MMYYQSFTCWGTSALLAEPIPCTITKRADRLAICPIPRVLTRTDERFTCISASQQNISILGLEETERRVIQFPTLDNYRISLGLPDESSVPWSAVHAWGKWWVLARDGQGGEELFICDSPDGRLYPASSFTRASTEDQMILLGHSLLFPFGNDVVLFDMTLWRVQLLTPDMKVLLEKSVPEEAVVGPTTDRGLIMLTKDGRLNRLCGDLTFIALGSVSWHQGSVASIIQLEERQVILMSEDDKLAVMSVSSMDVESLPVDWSEMCLNEYLNIKRKESP